MASTILQRIAYLESVLPGVNPSISTSSPNYTTALQQARALISELNASPQALATFGLQRYIGLIYKLQKLAYANADNGGKADIASWCERQWATIIHRNPQNSAALQGICP